MPWTVAVMRGGRAVHVGVGGGDTVPDVTDETMARIGAAMAEGPDVARRVLGEIWRDPAADALHRVAVAHHLADLQDDPRAELAWDQRALAAAEGVSDERVRAAGVGAPVRAFYPSLHLNLGESYRKVGDLDAAREHLARGRACAGALDDDGYGRMIRAGLDDLAARLDAP
jgi:hypothetical protein